MARKQFAAVETDQKPGTNGSVPVRGAKTAAIRELYAQGIKKAKQISDAMASQGLSVSMPVIYTTLKELKKGGKGKGKPGRKPKATLTTVAIMEVPGPKPSTTSAGVTADDLLQLAEITKKVGGVDAVVSLLNVVKHFQ